jgi:CheY-like chemotaxis protein
MDQSGPSPETPAIPAFKKILVVDDIVYVVKSITKILRDEGYFILTATTGKEALDKYRKYSPELMTIDQKLPDMTGLQLVDAILSLKSDPPPKVIFISSVYDRKEIERIMKHKIDDYLLKPFQKSKLIEAVKRLI